MKSELIEKRNQALADKKARDEFLLSFHTKVYNALKFEDGSNDIKSKAISRISLWSKIDILSVLKGGEDVKRLLKSLALPILKLPFSLSTNK